MNTAEILKKVRQIEIKTGRLVSETFAGQYQSIFKGRGVEFADVREYIPGDDMKMSDGSPRYVLLSYFPNKDIKNATAPAQIVVIDREVGIKKKESLL